MTDNLDSSSLDFSIHRFLSENQVRFIVQKDSNKNIPFALSIYEVHLTQKTKSYNSVYDNLYCLTFLYAWADYSKINIDEITLKGEFLSSIQVNQFAFWLKSRGKRKKQNEQLSIQVINRILSYSQSFFSFFAFQYAELNEKGIERATKLETYRAHIKNQFATHKIKERKKRVADELTEVEVCKIENFLRPEKRLKSGSKIEENQAVRDYLFWRLAIEFGLRESEILALRLNDLPSRESNTIKVLRVEQRGAGYVDPRGKYAPRPKTLSRELGFVLSNSPIPHLITEYTTKHRKRKVIKHGRKVFQWIMDEPAFLLLSHRHDKGDPLSLSSAQDIAKDIRNATGVDFHWHLARHAFFNRAYAGLLELKDRDPDNHDARLEDLVYWGGWESSKSLQIYVNRARRDRAEKALSIYGTRQTWEALNHA